MHRVMLALGMVLLVADCVIANAPPPITPPQTAEYPAEYTIRTQEVYLDYDFYLVGKNIHAVKFGPNNPIKLSPKSGESYSYRLVAAPKGATANYPTETDFHNALHRDGIKGALRATIEFQSPVQWPTHFPKSDQSVSFDYLVEEANAKDGLVLLSKYQFSHLPKPLRPQKGTKYSPPNLAAPLAPQRDGSAEGAPKVSVLPSGRLWPSGLAATLAMTLGGYWLVTRTRRKL